ncbi:MAG: hypothetical protein ACP5OE_09580 [Thermodesulfobium sp.]
MRSYIAVLISENGEDYTTDYKSKTKADVIRKLIKRDENNEWYSYTYSFIIQYDPLTPIKESKIVLSFSAFGLKKFKGRRIEEAMEYIKEHHEYFFLRGLT